MEGLISTFHIDVKIIIAQIVNFGIVFIVLYLFALKPLGKLMRARRAEIEKGLTDAKSSETELIAAKQKAEKEIKKAQAQANDILGEAKKKGDLIIINAQEKANDETEKTISEAEKKIERDREQMENDLLEKTASLITLGVAKILDVDVDESKNKSINKRALEFLKKS